MNATNTTAYCSSLSSFPTNPDITGVGVRVAFYLSTFVGFYMAIRFPYDLDAYRDAARTSLVTSSSLVIAALYARYDGLGITLVDAQIVTMLTLIINACYWTVSQFSFGLTTGIAVALHTILSAIWGIFVYYNVKDFGLSECKPNNEFTFVFFCCGGVSATNQGVQVFALLAFTLLIASYLIPRRGSLVLAILAVYVSFTEAIPREPRNPAAGERRRTLGEGLQELLTLLRKSVRAPKKIPKTASWAGFFLIIWLIVTIEETIRINGLHSSIIDDWTFGQTVAVGMVFDQVTKAILSMNKNFEEEAAKKIRAQRIAD